MAVLGIQTLVRSVTGQVLTRQGNRVQHLAPRGAWKTLDDRWISVTVGNDNTFKSLALAMEQPDLPNDPRFASNRARLAHVDEIEAVLADWFAGKSNAEALERLERYNVACAPLYDAEQLMQDPQFISREAFVTVADDDLQQITLPNVLARFSRTPGRVRFAGKRLGEDNQSVYAERLGLGADEVASLHERGVI